MSIREWLFGPRIKTDWSLTGETRWTTVKHAGGYAHQRLEAKWVDFESGATEWRLAYRSRPRMRWNPTRIVAE